MNLLGPFFNPNTIQFVSSSDGGSELQWPGSRQHERLMGRLLNAIPSQQSSISQGRLPSQSGKQGDAGIPGGQVTVGWTDFGANQNQLMVNPIAPGKDYRFDGATGVITGNANPPTPRP